MPPAPYLLLDFTLVADSWTALVDPNSGLHHAIDLTELQSQVTQAVAVWTGTSALGQATGSDCAAWTNASDGVATVGSTIEVSGWLTEQETNLTCTESYRI